MGGEREGKERETEKGREGGEREKERERERGEGERARGVWESVEMIIWNLNTQDEEVAAENLDLHYVSSPTGRSYSPSRKMHDLGEALPDTVSTNNFYSWGVILLKFFI